MQKIEHTPLPWKERNGYITQDVAVKPLHIAVLCEIPHISDGSEQANAAYIVRACNVHYELLEALSNMVSCFESASETALDRKVIKAADAAIRKAQSE